MFKRSLSVGLRYDVLSEEALKFLQSIKTLTVDDEESGKKGLDLRE